MAFRTIGKFRASSRVSVLIQRCSDWQEFRARLMLDGQPVPDADYHTDDRQDAHDTARAMGQHLAAQNPVTEQ